MFLYSALLKRVEGKIKVPPINNPIAQGLSMFWQLRAKHWTQYRGAQS